MTGETRIGGDCLHIVRKSEFPRRHLPSRIAFRMKSAAVSDLAADRLIEINEAAWPRPIFLY
jgi:hypothetical protein